MCIRDRSYTIRFTPRRPGSNWSAVNLERVAELMAQELDVYKRQGQLLLRLG